MSKLAEPAPLASTSPGPYFQFDNTRLTLRECWNFSRRPTLFLTMVALKLAGSRIPPRSLIPPPDATRRLDADEVPAEVRQALALTTEYLGRQGFVLAFACHVRQLGDHESYSLHFLSPERQTWAVVTDSRSGKVHERSLTFQSFRTDDHLLATTDGRRRFNPCPWVDTVYLRGVSSSDLWETHRQRLADCPVAIEPIDPQGLFERFLEQSRRHFRHMVGRGVYRAATPEEIARFLSRSRPEERTS
jgi:hypothetical protein